MWKSRVAFCLYKYHQLRSGKILEYQITKAGKASCFSVEVNADFTIILNWNVLKVRILFSSCAVPAPRRTSRGNTCAPINASALDVVRSAGSFARSHTWRGAVVLEIKSRRSCAGTANVSMRLLAFRCIALANITTRTFASPTTRNSSPR